MITIRNETGKDVERREALLDRVWGRSRLQKTAERLREGRLPAEGLSFIAEQTDRVIGSVRLWNIAAGPDRPALLLGPLAVDEAWRNLGIGTALMRRAVDIAGQLDHGAILLVGDAPYYGRFGFSAEKTGRLWLPGPYEQHRLLGRELAPSSTRRRTRTDRGNRLCRAKARHGCAYQGACPSRLAPIACSLSGAAACTSKPPWASTLRRDLRTRLAVICTKARLRYISLTYRTELPVRQIAPLCGLMEDHMVARMRHIALLVTDPEKSAQFYEKTLGFKRAGKAGRGLYMSDGTINMALLQVRPDKGEKPGLYHFGMWVDDLDESEKTVSAAGGSYLMGREDRNPDTFYEVKYRDPDGIVFDITPTGWRGAVKEVAPAEAAKEAAE